MHECTTEGHMTCRSQLMANLHFIYIRIFHKISESNLVPEVHLCIKNLYIGETQQFWEVY
jgi:hypothetical protein